MAATAHISSPRLAGRVAFITGGASGLGLASARRLLADGARVVLADLNAAALATAQAELASAFGTERVCTTSIDVGEPESVSEAVDRAASDCGGLHILVNSAGISYQGSVLETRSTPGNACCASTSPAATSSRRRWRGTWWRSAMAASC